MTEYKRPQVWEWDTPNNEVTGNKPTAGARFEQELPRGDKPYQLYSLGHIFLFLISQKLKDEFSLPKIIT